MLTGAENCLLFEYMSRWSSTFLQSVLPIALISNDENTIL